MKRTKITLGKMTNLTMCIKYTKREILLWPIRKIWRGAHKVFFGSNGVDFECSNIFLKLSNHDGKNMRAHETLRKIDHIAVHIGY